MARRIIRRDVKRSRKITRVKIPSLVVSAIKNLRNSKGSTSNKIVNYVARVSDISKASAKRRVDVALRRAVNYGVLKCHRGHYSLDVESPCFDYAKMRSKSSRRRATTLKRNSTSPKKSIRNRKGVKPFCMVVRKPLLSVRKRSKNTRSKSSPHQLSDMYCNPSYKASTDSSVASSLSGRSSDLQETSDFVRDQD